MALRRILTAEEPTLHKVSRPVTKFDEKLWTLLDDMAETLADANGVGLAAPQVGILRRVVVIDVGDEIVELINPEIMETNNWFLYGTTNQNIYCLTRELLYAYWKDNDRAVDYYIFHLFMTMACDYYREEYQAMPIVSQVESHVLATYMTAI